MAKTKTIFTCQECGSKSHRWAGKCESCGAWNSMVEGLADKSGKFKSGKKISPKPIKDVEDSKSIDRLKTGIDEIDNVFGGGLVRGSLILLAGEPGIGKSTMLLQLAKGVVGSSEGKVLYVSGEESQHQVKLRSNRLDTTVDDLDIATSTSTNDVASTIEDGGYDLVIIDSIQTMSCDEISSSAGTVSQISNSAQLLQNASKKSDTTLLMVGHVTKSGNIAGPKILEHLVDVVMYLEGEKYGGFKLLRGVKNRFGPTHEVGMFEMQDDGLNPVLNPSEALLSERQATDGSVVLATLEGSRPLLVEVQALVSSSPFGYPKRTASGIDLNRLNLLIAVVNRRTGIRLGDKDVYVNVVGGLKIDEPAADLAVCLAIASAAKKKALPKDVAICGEVGLSGEIRRVSHIDKRANEAKKLGFKSLVSGQVDKNSSITKKQPTVKSAVDSLLK